MILKDELVLLAPPDPAASEAPDAMALADRFPLLIQRLGCSYTERFISHLMASGTRTPRLVEAGTLEGVLGFVEQGLGIAVVPRTFAERLAQRVQVVSLSEFWKDRHVNIHLVSASQREPGQGLALFLRHCRSVLGAGEPTEGNKRNKGDRDRSAS